jgi:hypothetical protein
MKANELMVNTLIRAASLRANREVQPTSATRHCTTRIQYRIAVLVGDERQAFRQRHVQRHRIHLRVAATKGGARLGSWC